MLTAAPEYFFGSVYLLHHRREIGTLMGAIAVGLVATVAA